MIPVLTTKMSALLRHVWNKDSPLELCGTRITRYDGLLQKRLILNVFCYALPTDCFLISSDCVPLQYVFGLFADNQACQMGGHDEGDDGDAEVNDKPLRLAPGLILSGKKVHEVRVRN